MKFSKFVKAPQHKASSSVYSRKKSSNLNTTLTSANAENQQQLLLTDNICRFQPAKNKLFLDDSLCTNVKMPSTPQATTPKITFSQSAFAGLVVSANGSGGKFLKTNQPKRLQRNRLQHVTAKPINYVLRSTLNIKSVRIGYSLLFFPLKSNQIKHDSIVIHLTALFTLCLLGLFYVFFF